MEVVLMCAWCGRVNMNGWVEGHEAARALNERRVSHGICGRCFEQLMTAHRPERSERRVG
jgi:hypothetical protein